MTVNDLIKQLEAMSEEDRERVVVIPDLDDYCMLTHMSAGWCKAEQGDEVDCPWQQDRDKGFVVIDDRCQRALVLGRIE